jgi:N-carbamoyl-L-amino-acid hydrolase
MIESLRIDPEAVRNDILRTADFGMVDSEDGVARTVLPGTQANGRARTYLVDQMVAAGLEVTVDAVGNITGRWTPPNSDRTTSPVAAGSHLDSVPMGGIFDGPLGVYAALEAVRTIKDSALSVRRPIDVVCFTGEEGTRFTDGVLGSSVAAGKLSVADALSLSDGEVTLETALDEIGFRGEGRLDASNWASWLELHVEQNDVLERADEPVGVVTSITGTTRCHVQIDGEPDHAGTASMGDRTDALAAASELVLALEAAANRIVAEESESAVATVGSLSVSPGVVNVVPAGVELEIDIRDVDGAMIERLVETVEDTCDSLRRERGVDVTVERPYDIAPKSMADSLRTALQRAASAVDLEPPTLHSGAGHDTMEVAEVTDTGMLFARSRGGHSHSPLEYTNWLDCGVATQVLTLALAETAGVEQNL